MMNHAMQLRSKPVDELKTVLHEFGRKVENDPNDDKLLFRCDYCHENRATQDQISDHIKKAHKGWSVVPTHKIQKVDQLNFHRMFSWFVQKMISNKQKEAGKKRNNIVIDLTDEDETEPTEKRGKKEGSQ